MSDGKGLERSTAEGPGRHGMKPERDNLVVLVRRGFRGRYCRGQRCTRDEEGGLDAGELVRLLGELLLVLDVRVVARGPGLEVALKGRRGGRGLLRG